MIYLGRRAVIGMAIVTALIGAGCAQAAASPTAQKRAVIAYCTSQNRSTKFKHWSKARGYHYVLTVMIPRERRIGPMFNPIWTLETKMVRDLLHRNQLGAYGVAIVLKATAKAAGIGKCAS